MYTVKGLIVHNQIRKSAKGSEIGSLGPTINKKNLNFLPLPFTKQVNKARRLSRKKFWSFLFYLIHRGRRIILLLSKKGLNV